MGDVSESLRVARLQLLSREECEAAVADPRWAGRQLCTKPIHGAATPWKGDSGGPLVQDGVVVGVVSRGYWRNSLALYTRPQLPGGDSETRDRLLQEPTCWADSLGGRGVWKERVKIREPVTVTSFLVITCFALSSFLFGFSGPGYASAALFVVTTGITVTEMLKEEEIEILQYDERHLKTETYRILSQMQCEKQITHFKDKDDWHNNLLCTKPFPGKSVYDSGGLLVQDGVLVGIWCRITEYNSFFLRGDSGGPFFKDGVVIGIVSAFAKEINLAFFTRVSQYVDWIQKRSGHLHDL
ncbi:Trypsin-2 [Gryllus bimaculatus]|nr:Trypsin-2 [Gryllus bimaculatus]